MKLADKKLFEACESGKKEDVEAALQAKSDVNCVFKLTDFLEKDELTAYKNFNENPTSGINKKLQDKISQFSGFIGCTPLHVAAIKGQLNIVKLLIQHGADAHATVQPITDGKIRNSFEKGKNCIHLVVQYCVDEEKAIQVISYLIGKEEKVDINAQDNLNNTPLHFAKERPKITKFLIDNGAKVEVENMHGASPSMWRKSSNPKDTDHQPSVTDFWNSPKGSRKEEPKMQDTKSVEFDLDNKSVSQP